MPCFCLKSLPFWYKEKRANFIFVRSCLIVVAPKSVLPSSSALRVLSCLQAINPWLKIIVTYFAGLLGIHALRTNNFEFQTWKPGFQTRRKSNIIYFPQGFIAIANAKDVIIANKIPIYRSVPSKNVFLYWTQLFTFELSPLVNNDRALRFRNNLPKTNFV